MAPSSPVHGTLGMFVLWLLALLAESQTKNFFGTWGLGEIDHPGKLNSISTLKDTIAAAKSCLTNTGFSDPFIGNFSLDPSHYCDCRCSRCVPRITCCVPQPPGEIKARFRFFEPGKEERDILWSDSGEWEAFKDGQIVFVVHGWIEKVSTSPWILPITLGWVARGRKVILVDWRHGNTIDYFQAMANVRTLGAQIGYSILNWGIAERTLIVGFSLGAQITAEAGQFTQEHGHVMINECHGLDPAGPFYDGCGQAIQLDRSDCKLVQVLHTSAERVQTAGVLTASLGSYQKAGHCDYWVNCGHYQGLCKDMKIGQMMDGAKELFTQASDGKIQAWLQTQFCSHWRAPLAYLSQLTGKCHYSAELCKDCGMNLMCRADAGNVSIANTLPPDGLCSNTENVNYYVKSGPYDPYC